jgi:hypothetical protein
MRSRSHLPRPHVRRRPAVWHSLGVLALNLLTSPMFDICTQISNIRKPPSLCEECVHISDGGFWRERRLTDALIAATCDRATMISCAS